MSQKVGKRSRRRTEDEQDDTVIETKNINISPEKKENGNLNGDRQEEVRELELKLGNSVSETTPDKKDEVEKKRIIQTRSRSTTPIIKKTISSQLQNESPQETEKKEAENSVEDLNTNNDKLNSSLESIEEEEGECQLQLEESSDVDSKADQSPILNKKRKKIAVITETKTVVDVETEAKSEESKTAYVSLVRMNIENIEVSNEAENKLNNQPETVKEPEKNTEQNVLNGNEESNDSFASLATNDLSTLAVCESNMTKTNAEFSFKDSDLFEGPSSTFLNLTKDHSLVETCRRLSSRRSIRPFNEDIRKRAFKNNLEGRDYLDSPYPSRYSVERITGMKRKHHSITPPDTKRAKTEGGILSYISKPISSLKRRMSRSDLQSSTPTLTGFKTKYEGFDMGMGSGSKVGLETGRDDLDKKWCSIM